MERIDAHHHFWFYRAKDYPWIDDRMSVLRRDFVPEDFEPEFRSAGVTGVISVEAQASWLATWQLLQFANEHSYIQAVVGWIPLLDPDLERKLPTMVEHPKLKGVRHNLQDDPDPEFMLREDFNRGIWTLRPWGLTYDILIYERHLPQTIQFVDKHPGQTFVLDHIAKPRIAAGELQPWAENLRELALRPHVYCKLSGMVTEADWPSWTEEQLKPYFNVVLEAFGPKRLMFGSDWPVCLLATTYQHWVQTVSKLIDTLSADEQARIWAETAREAYRL